MSFLQELRRRNVFRVAIAYMIMAWLALQITDVILNNIGAPDWVFRTILFLLGIGFPFSVFFAWAFELTPDGLRREKDVDREESVTHQTGRKLNTITTVLLMAALAYFVFDKFVLAPSRDADRVAMAVSEIQKAEASIAVLPFVNLSSDPEQEFFSDGISEELLNVLAQIPDLHVTSRSSAFAFKGKDISIPEVATQLGVAHVLEGSVRKSGTTVRITAQLIEAETDKHLWSETYDRDLDDIFAIQDEISAAIVDALVSEMGIDASTVSARPKATVDTEAYTSYLLAQHSENKRSHDGYIEAKRLYQKTIELDPDFATAHSRLAVLWLLESLGYGSAEASVADAISRSDELIARALELDSEDADAYAAMGLSLTTQERVEESIDALKRALEINPSNSRARNWLSMSYRINLRSREELETLREGHRRDPLAVAIATNLVKSLSRFQEYDEANEVLTRIHSLSVADHGFSSGEMLMLKGQYADAITAALRGEDADPGSRLTMHVAAETMAYMGEQVEAQRLDPWQGSYADFQVQLFSEIRNPADALQALESISGEDVDELYLQWAVMWANIGTRDFAAAESIATQRLSDMNSRDRAISDANLVLAIIDRENGNTEQALARIETLEAAVDANLAAGDQFALNYLIKAAAEFIRGDESTPLELLRGGFTDKAPMAFEGISVFAVAAGLGWDKRPAYLALLDEFEENNRSELGKIFATACGESGFTVWTPLPESCEKYAPTSL